MPEFAADAIEESGRIADAPPIEFETFQDHYLPEGETLPPELSTTRVARCARRP
jgi:hypothetical protein